jgi:hypothetical protein
MWLGPVPERTKGADCKSAGESLRWFESIPAHPLLLWRHWGGSVIGWLWPSSTGPSPDWALL